MGDIKSTIDLVMEKTKHLTMTEDEKSLAKTAQTKQKLRGMIQKFKDGILTRNQFGKEMDRIVSETNVDVSPLLLKELLEQVNLFENNSHLVDLLQNFCGISVKQLLSVLNHFQEDYRLAFQDRVKARKKEIVQKHGITGSAVVPNLDTDSLWQHQHQQLCELHQKILETQKAAYLKD